MKTCLWTVALASLTAWSYAQPVSLEFVDELETVQFLGNPLAIAADAEGGVYYTLLSVGDNTASAYYIPNPLDNPSPDDHIIVDDGLDYIIPNGRGITGIAVDGGGNVYLAFDTGSNDTGNITKRGPAPDFEKDAAFGDGGSVFGKRYNSVEVLTDGVIAASLFDSVEFFDAETGAPLHAVTGGELYQRDMAYDPETHSIYISKNSGEIPAPSANLLAGGGPDDLAGYSTITPGFIPSGGSLGQFGIKHQKIDFDAVNRLIVIPRYSPPEPLAEGETYQNNVAFYSPDAPGTPVASVDGSESPGGPMNLIGDAVAVQTGGATHVFITDTNPDGLKRILVYRLVSGSGAGDWAIHP